MLDQRMGLDCAFLSNPRLTHLNITSFNASLKSFVNPDDLYQEFFFVIDNTDFPLFNDTNLTTPS